MSMNFNIKQQQRGTQLTLHVNADLRRKFGISVTATY